MYYYTDKEAETLESIKKVEGLNAEQLELICKISDKLNNNIYKATYDKEDVVNEVFEHFENFLGQEIEDACEAETKIWNNKNFFNDVHNDLVDNDGYPDWDAFGSIVGNLADKHFEVTDGNLYCRGLAEM